MLLVGSFSMVLPVVAGRSAVDRGFMAVRATKVLPIIGAVMLSAALVVLVTKVNPVPRTDQGALARACGW